MLKEEEAYLVAHDLACLRLASYSTKRRGPGVINSSVYAY